MNFKSKVVSVFGAGIIALGMVGGAEAQESSATTVPVSVAVSKPQGGTVTWNVVVTEGFEATSTSLDTVNESTGTLGLTVTDERFNRAGWSISLAAGDFEGAETNETFGIGNLSFAPGTVEVVAGDTSEPTAYPITMDPAAREVFVANKGSGSGKYTVPLNGTIKIPKNTQADTYTTTIKVTGVAAP